MERRNGFRVPGAFRERAVKGSFFLHLELALIWEREPENGSLSLHGGSHVAVAWVN